jgi:uncharacterized protein YecT (DUF1311 family)
MTIHRTLVGLTSLICLAAPISAQTLAASAPDARPDVCIRQSADEALARACFDEQVAHMDTALAASWERAFSALGGRKTVAGRALSAEQRAWQQYRRKACAYLKVEPAGIAAYGRAQRCMQSLLSSKSSDLDFEMERVQTRQRAPQ